MYVKMRKSFILQNILRDLFAEDDQEAFQLNAEKQTLSSQHKTCRDVEAETCQGKRECEMKLQRK